MTGITAPLGFKASGIYCGIKKNRKSLDLALVYSVIPAGCAGVFTANRIKAAPVLVTKRHIKKQRAQAVIINSGNANCLNGKSGIEDAKAMIQAVAGSLCINKNDVLVASTGIIGKKLPVEKIKKCIPVLAQKASKNGGHNAAVAIMTTDTFAKEEAATFKIGSSKVTIGGMAKGSGMICPNLVYPERSRGATMICVLTTDAAIQKAALKKALKEAVSSSFNSITIDGDMSTNDTVVILANGLASNPLIKTGGRNYNLFVRALTSVCADLARKIVSDGEGAKKFIEVNVKNAASIQEARMAAKKIANSSLVKAAIAGGDPNWGRVAAAAGASGAQFSADRLEIYLNGIKVLKNGSAAITNPGALRKIFNKKNITIDVNLHNGIKDSTVWTCDLTTDYVKINASYST